MVELILGLITAAWIVLAAMAPYLLFGFLVAGLLSVLVSPEWVERHLGGRGLAQVFKAALFGVPLPLCSCGVIPVGASLRQHGASRGATTAFLLSTPQTGVDSIAVTYALMGPVLAVFRPLAALLTGFAGGALVHAFDRVPTPSPRADASDGASGCRDGQAGGCGCEPSGCGCEGERAAGGRLARALRYGLVDLPRDIGKPLLVGIALSALLSAVAPPDSLRALLGGGLLPILAAMAIGVPLYVCATASVPIAVGLIHLGLSPGAAVAFLISGPGTNAAAIATLYRVLGRRTAALYLLTVAVGAVVSGLVVDTLVSAADLPLSTFVTAAGHVSGHEGHQAGAAPGWIGVVSSAGLVAVLVNALRPRRRRPSAGGSAEAPAAAPGLELRIGGLHCQGCVQALTRALSELPGVGAVEVELGSGRARVEGRPDLAAVRAAVDGLGYTLLDPDAAGGEGQARR